jgi:hypothetical protein
MFGFMVRYIKYQYQDVKWISPNTNLGQYLNPPAVLVVVDCFRISECRLRKDGVATGVTKSVRYGFEQTISNV